MSEIRRKQPCHLVLFASLMIVAPQQAQSAAKLSGGEARFHQCVLKEARASGYGNPMVAAYNAADRCPSKGLLEAERERAIGAAVRQIMKDVGMGCIGTGCS